MKLASFLYHDQSLYGLVTDQGVRPVRRSTLARFPDLRSLIAAGATDQLDTLCEEAPLDLAEVTLLPPIPEPGKIICIGMNYRKPYPVEGVAPPDPNNVVLFGRQPETFVAPGAELQFPIGEAGKSFDYEGEIVAVIGKGGRHIAEDQAMSHVLGYSAMNEGSVRGWMKHSVHAGKNFHASGSWGPCIATVDETGPIEDMRLEVFVNGELRQSCLGGEMIFNLPQVIAYVSHVMPLAPGDIIATGSPDGTGGSRTPPGFLRHGDEVRVTVAGVGSLVNRVSAS